jgi:hypothetical protein
VVAAAAVAVAVAGGATATDGSHSCATMGELGHGLSSPAARQDREKGEDR